MQKVILSLIVIVFSMFSFSCFEQPTPPEPISGVSGVVTNNYGEPLKNVIVETKPVTKKMVTDETGRFTFEGSGVFEITATFNFGSKKITVQKNVEATSKIVVSDVELNGFGEVKGKITNEFGTPVVGKTVSVLTHSVQTSATGEYSIKVPYGIYSILIENETISANVEVSATPTLLNYVFAFTQVVLVETGIFEMGSNSGEGNEKPTHQVSVDDFYIGKYPVTQKEWYSIMGTNPSKFIGENLPVESVSWNDVQIFIQKLNQKTGLKYRLPTEAEWEFAARGGKKSSGFLFSGSNTLDEVGWYSDNSSSRTQPVGGKKPNELGIYDMSGNVWEWVNDWYWLYESKAQNNPKGPSNGTYRVRRGGSWGNLSSGCRVTVRDGAGLPDSRDDHGGFRLAHGK